MKRALQGLLICLSTTALAALATGCMQSALPAPKPAPPVDIETRALPLKQPRDLPRLLAPPPAYGNKIVIAQLSTRERQN